MGTELFVEPATDRPVTQRPAWKELEVQMIVERGCVNESLTQIFLSGGPKIPIPNRFPADNMIVTNSRQCCARSLCMS